MTGKALLDAIENSVSAYPALEGRFPQVSNITFEFDPKKLPNHRVLWTRVGDKPLDFDREYTLVTRGYMARGKDGFDSLLAESEGGTAQEIVHEENGMLISMIIRQYFMSLKIMGRWKHWGHGMHRHWRNIHEELHDVHPVVKPRPSGASTPVREDPAPHKEMGKSHLSEQVVFPDDHPDSSDDETHQHAHVVDAAMRKKRETMLARKVIRKWWRLAGLKGHPNCADTLDEGELEMDWTHVSGSLAFCECLSLCLSHRNARYRANHDRRLRQDWNVEYEWLVKTMQAMRRSEREPHKHTRNSSSPRMLVVLEMISS